MLNTDLEKVESFDESKLTPEQAQVFSQLSPKIQNDIREGYGVVVADLKDGGQKCSFNMENYRPPDYAIESFARMLLPEIQKYFSNEENVREFEEWKAKEGNEK